MAEHKVVNTTQLEADLTSIADAIRAKAETSDPIAFPSGFVDAIANIEAGGSDIEKYLEGLTTEVSLPNATKLKNWAFYYHRGLTKISMPNVKEIGYSAFNTCASLELTELPSGVERIMNGAFSYCSNVTITEIPSSVTFIDNIAFQGCDRITTLTFKGKPSDLQPGAFASCDNLTTINVPWAEGEVANAPWAATNAAINYNYSENEEPDEPTDKDVVDTTTEPAKNLPGDTGEEWTITTYSDGSKEAELTVELKLRYFDYGNDVPPMYAYPTDDSFPYVVRLLPTGFSTSDAVEATFISSSDGRTVTPYCVMDSNYNCVSFYGSHMAPSTNPPSEGEELTVTYKVKVIANQGG